MAWFSAACRRAGIKKCTTLGATDELGYFVTEGKMSVHDLRAIIPHLLGLDPWKHSFAYQGLQQRLICPKGEALIRHEILAWLASEVASAPGRLSSAR